MSVGLLIPTFLVAMGTLWGSPVLTLNPLSGNVTGAQGSTVGWGFTITNDTNYIEIISAQFCINPVNFPLLCGTPTTGTFTDFISGFNDIIVGPPGGTDPISATQVFDPLAFTGIGKFVIAPGAPITSELGQIVLTYRVTDLDPLDPNAQEIATDVVLSANASVTVVAGTSTPEPGAAMLMAFGLAALVVKSLKRPGSRKRM